MMRRPVVLPLGAVRLALASLMALAGAFFEARADSGFPYVSAAAADCKLIVTGPKHTITGMTMGNTGGGAWIKFYDMNTVPVAGASQGFSPGGNPYVFPIPGNANIAGTNTFPPPINFQAGIAFCVTGGVANADTTAVTSGQVAGTIIYQ